MFECYGVPSGRMASFMGRTILLALQSVFTVDMDGAVGSLKCSDEERRRLALECSVCDRVVKDDLKTHGTGRTLGEAPLEFSFGKPNKHTVNEIIKDEADKSEEGQAPRLEIKRNTTKARPLQFTDYILVAIVSFILYKIWH
ncbi:hypothetical protein O9G_001197 [Rozella allomycis CSF55]|uniref:Uncharacterized protein n=1 Tax=Rozella allomycis (strain CSF55) TaxID=988480 RepID=A0A075ASJ2_ROZAC|nr:hypothetical protein O9G_001197 [Rozella allomycis CSF55]|eukprot:EPZ33228.1 hypothetical protein O9G_001197 [Rozella allomycis CSF55]